MDRLSPLQRKLDAALSDLATDSEAMLLSQFDGLVAGVLVCPDLILPGEWLPLLWGGEGEGAAAIEDVQQLRDLTAMAMEHYNAVATTLQRRQGYAPIFEVDARHDETIWEIWMEGFDAAVRLRPRVWYDASMGGDKTISEPFAMMMHLADIAYGESDLSRDAIELLTSQAPLLIQELVETLNEWRLENRSDPFVSPPSVNAGRNDPCPCGSGKKYKKCCLVN